MQRPNFSPILSKKFGFWKQIGLKLCLLNDWTINMKAFHFIFFIAGKILKRTQLRWTHRRGFDPQIAQFRRRLQQIHRFYVGRVLRSRSSHRKTSTNQTKNSPPINRKYTFTTQYAKIKNSVWKLFGKNMFYFSFCKVVLKK